MLACIVLFGGIPQAVAYSAQPLCWSSWETHSPLTLTGEQYGKMEPKYSEGGHCQSVLHLQGCFLTSPFIWNNSVETAAPFNAVSHPRCCEPRNYSLERFRPLAGIEPETILPMTTYIYKGTVIPLWTRYWVPIRERAKLPQQLGNYLMQYHYICVVKALIAVY